MRKIIGYIRNLTDGLGPPPGSVEVAAKPIATGFDINAATDSTGTLSFEHASGSGSNSLADTNGRFAWSFELNPGPINVEVVPHDPQLEYRRRFPDESAQVGMAFHSDIQRIGWAAGGDCMIWNAIVGGDDPAPASWQGDPNVTWNRGNGSIASFNADRTVTIRPFIGFVGGVLFSVESGNLVVPVGGSPAGPNLAGQDRWDLLELVLNTDALSTRYGQQTIQITPGTPGAAISSSTPPTSIERRFALHALKMPAGASVYTQAFDLRTWQGNNTPTAVAPPQSSTMSRVAGVEAAAQIISWGQANVASVINTDLSSNEMNLAPGRGYTGIAALHVQAQAKLTPYTELQFVTPHFPLRLKLHLKTEGRGVSGGTAIAGTDFINQAQGDYSIATTLLKFPATGIILAEGEPGLDNIINVTFLWMLGFIPGYDAESQITATTRSWNKLRFTLHYTFNDPLGDYAHYGPFLTFTIWKQVLTYNIWPA